MIEYPTISVINADGTQVYEDWKSITLRSSLNKTSSDLSIETIIDPDVVRVVRTSTPTDWFAGSKVIVNSVATNPETGQEIANEVIFTGRLEKLRTTIRSGIEDSTISCRSLSAVLTDSNPLKNKVSVKLSSIKTYVDSLTSDFRRGTFRIPNTEYRGSDTTSIVLNDGIHIFETIERSILNGMQSLSAGTITSTKKGGIKVILDNKYEEVGQINNILSISYEVDESNRFHIYQTSAQSTNGLEQTGASSNKIDAEVRDQNVKDVNRLRRVRVNGNQQGNFTKKYAEWMKNNSYAKSRKADVEIVGWRNSNGVLYEPGQLVSLSGPVSDRVGATADDWLIQSVQLSIKSTSNVARSGAGTIAKLTLVKKEAYSREPIDYDLLKTASQGGVPGF